MDEKALQEIERDLRIRVYQDSMNAHVPALIAEVRRLRDKEMQQCPTCKQWVRNKPILGTLHVCAE